MANLCSLFLTGFLFWMNISGMRHKDAQLQGSQFPWSVAGPTNITAFAARTNPRVGDRSTTIPEAPTGVKETGGAKHSGHNWSNSRKRAYRRARRRAEQQGGTWHSASSLGAQPLTEAGKQAEATVNSPPRCRALPRLQVSTYNVGGFTQEIYTYIYMKCSRTGWNPAAKLTWRRCRKLTGVWEEMKSAGLCQSGL